MNIRQHRFVPNMSTTSKVFLDKKTKSKSRRNLKLELRRITIEYKFQLTFYQNLL